MEVIQLMTLEINQQLQLLPDAIMATVLVVTAILDIKYMLIYNSITYPIIIGGVLINGINGNFYAIGWFFICTMIMLFISCIYHDGLGGGDIKLTGAIAAWLGDERSILVILIAFICGGIFATILIAYKRRYCKDMKIPFAPFLAIGGIVSMAVGCDILIWYVNILLG